MKLYTLTGKKYGTEETTYLCISGDVETVGYEGVFHRYDFEMNTKEEIEKYNHTIYVTTNKKELEEQNIEKMDEEDKGYVFTDHTQVQIKELCDI